MAGSIKPERIRTRILRLYKIEQLLIEGDQGLTARELSKLLLVNRRTIYRDIELIQELGIPLYDYQGRFKILGTYRIPSYRPKLIDAIGVNNEPIPSLS